MRVLITVQPLMYREALALAIHKRRPDIEVLVGPEDSLDGGPRDSRRTCSCETTPTGPTWSG